MPLLLAGAGTSNPVRVADRLFLNMIGANYRYVSGYTGQSESILALTRGEVNLDVSGLVAYLSRRETIRNENIFDAVLQRGELGSDGKFRRNRLLPEIPTTVETISEINPAALTSPEFAAYRIIIGAFALQFGLVLPPGPSESLVSTLSKAVNSAINDPEAKKVVQDSLKVEYDFIDGATCERIISQIRSEYQSDARIASAISQLMAPK